MGRFALAMRSGSQRRSRSHQHGQRFGQCADEFIRSGFVVDLFPPNPEGSDYAIVDATPGDDHTATYKPTAIRQS
jgi:hypothetical protein